MSGVSMRAEVYDSGIRAKLIALIALGKNPADAMRDIATYGENSTRERFSLQVGPDGKRWKPSMRVRLRGGKTLTQSGHLGNSITSRSSKDVAEWGTNRIYALIHQLGGVIKPKTASSLRFRLASGAFVSTKKVTMPPRPYLGLNQADNTEILDILEARIQGAH